jgi:CubicO group peptidase (beta-lactamase class C family)
MKKLLLLFTAALALNTVFAQDAIKPDLKKLDATFAKALKDWNVPGMAIGIVKDDSLVFAKGYGVRDVAKGGTVDANTLFAIASNTKSMTAAAIATLVDDKKLNWDDPVTKYLPYFELYDPYVTHEMTIRDLLCHRSGLATFSGDLLWYGTKYSREEIVRRAKYLKPAYSFRTTYGYSNIMFIAAGEIVAKVSGKSWDEYVKEKFFTPLGMNRTVTTTNALPKMENVASCHTEVDGKMITIPWLNWDNVAPAGAVISSVNDMSKWLRLQIKRGKHDGKQYFSEYNARQMWSMHTNQKVSNISEAMWPSTHFKGYGLGWGLMDYMGKRIISHSGGYDGMISYTCVVPEINMGFVILTNANSTLFYPCVYYILDAYLKGTNYDWSQTFLERDNKSKDVDKTTREQEEKNRIKNTKPSLDLKEYCGTYKCELYGTATIKMEGENMQLQLDPAPDFVGKLNHWHYDTFSICFEKFPSLPPGKVTFTLDAEAKVKSMLIDVPNPDFDFTELDFKKSKH